VVRDFADDCSEWPLSRRSRLSILKDNATVYVGSVVPHRHREVGPRVPYINAKSLPAWGRICSVQDRRRFTGTLFSPPFVAVRRTSSPHDGARGIGSIVATKTPVSMENH